MGFAGAGQLQIYAVILLFLLIALFIWFVLLVKYFSLLSSSEPELFWKLGSPDITKGKFGNEWAFLKHLFSSEPVSKDPLVKSLHSKLRLAFICLVLIFIMSCSFIIFQFLENP